MKKIFYVIILLSLSKDVLGQTFKQFKQTQFYSLSTDKKLKGDIRANTYLKKGDTILIVSNLDQLRFLELFERTPSSFDSLFKKLPRIGYKDSKTDKFNEILKQTKYKTHADISFPVLLGDEGDEIRWYIVNSDHLSGKNSCDLSILFKVKNNTTDKTAADNLEYLKVVANNRSTFGQTLDSLENIKPFRSVIKDTIVLGKKHHRIDYDNKGRVIAVYAQTKTGTKNGPCVFFEYPGQKLFCIGSYKNGLKHGKWFQYWNLCTIKFNAGKEVKRRYRF